MLNLLDEYKNVDFQNGNLVISTSILGFSTIIASKLLSMKQSFVHVGNYFSENISHSITKLADGYLSNGDCFFNKEIKCLLIVFTTSPSKDNKRSFFDELDSFITKNNFSKTTLISGFIEEYQTDEELNKKIVEPYYLTNNDEIKVQLEKSGAKSFVDLCNLKKDNKKVKELDEVKYLTASGFSKWFLRNSKKKKQNYVYICSFVRHILDLEAALSIYLCLCKYLSLNEKLFEMFTKEDLGKTKILVPKLTLNKNITDLEKFFSEEWKKLVC